MNPAFPPAPLAVLLREGWSAAAGPAAELAAGRITTEKALSEALLAVRRHWAEFWDRLRAVAPALALELGKELAGERFVVGPPPLTGRPVTG